MNARSDIRDRAVERIERLYGFAIMEGDAHEAMMIADVELLTEAWGVIEGERCPAGCAKCANAYLEAKELEDYVLTRRSVVAAELEAIASASEPAS